MKYKFLFFLFTVSAPSFAQTGGHVDVPGTRCSLIPPAGFTAAANFSGFEHRESGASIMVNELPVAYDSLVNGFSEENLKTKGMTLIKKESTRFNDKRAVLLYIAQPLGGIRYYKQVLGFGDTAGTVLVNGIYPETAPGMADTIKAALFSTVYKNEAAGSPGDAVPFEVHTRGTIFKQVRLLAGGLLYSPDGKIPSDEPMLFVTASIRKVTDTDRKRYAAERLKKLPGAAAAVIKEPRDLVIDGLSGYEMVAGTKDAGGREELLYQVMLFTDNGDYYIIVGQAKEEADKNLEIFRTVARSFRRR